MCTTNRCGNGWFSWFGLWMFFLVVLFVLVLVFPHHECTADSQCFTPVGEALSVCSSFQCVCGVASLDFWYQCYPLDGSFGVPTPTIYPYHQYGYGHYRGYGSPGAAGVLFFLFLLLLVLVLWWAVDDEDVEDKKDSKD